MTLQVVVVAKQCAMHYMMPAWLLIIPCLVIVMKIHERNFIVKFLNRKKITGVMAAFIFSVLVFARYIYAYGFFPGLNHPGKEMNRQVVNLQYDIALFENQGMGPLPGPALSFGVSYSGDRQQYYRNILANMYPNFYMTTPLSETFRDWYNEISVKKVLRDSMRVLYYHPANDTFNVQHLCWVSAGLCVDSILFSYQHPYTKESIFLIRVGRK
jgi:hypothetical protein